MLFTQHSCTPLFTHPRCRPPWQPVAMHPMQSVMLSRTKGALCRCAVATWASLYCVHLEHPIMVESSARQRLVSRDQLKTCTFPTVQGAMHSHAVPEVGRFSEVRSGERYSILSSEKSSRPDLWKVPREMGVAWLDCRTCMRLSKGIGCVQLGKRLDQALAGSLWPLVIDTCSAPGTLLVR
jgi:hypothetical protein